MPLSRVFLSYSTHVPEHQLWVRALDNYLRQHGIHTTLDLHSLQVGDDLQAFMKSLCDHKVVVVVCDRLYQQRANHNEGGVGYEAQLLQELLQKKLPRPRIIPLYIELDEEGQPTLPEFLRGRRALDFTEEALYAEKCAALLLCIRGEMPYPPSDIGLAPSLEELAEKARRTRPKLLTNNIPNIDLQQFVGRNRELEELRDLLHNQQQVVLVNSMGGLGKTALAQAYVKQYGSDYQHIAWINVRAGSDNPLLTIVNTEGFLKNLRVFLIEKESLEELFRRVMHTLTLLTGPCLLILDDVGKAIEEIYDILPRQPYWHLLATSRMRLYRFHNYTLDFLAPDKAVALFRLHCDNARLTVDFLHTLVERIGYHTLTIEVLAKMANYAHYDEVQIEAELLAALPENLSAEVDIGLGKPDSVERVTDYLCRLFKRQLEQLSDEQRSLLGKLVHLPTVHYSFPLLEALLITKEADDPRILSRNLTTLEERGWLLKGTDDEQRRTYQLHTVVQTVVERLLDEKLVDSQMSFLIDRTMELSTYDQHKDNPITLEIWLPTGAYLEERWGNNHGSITLIRLQFNLAALLQVVGNFKAARQLYRKAKESIEYLYGSYNLLIAKAYIGLSTVEFSLGNLGEAKRFLELAIGIRMDIDDSSLAVCYSNLSLIEHSMGNLSKAKCLLEEAIEIELLSYDKMHPALSNKYSNLLIIEYEIGNLIEAKRLGELAIYIDSKHFESDHPNFIVNYSNLSKVERELGNLSEAKRLLELSFELGAKQYDQNHPFWATSYSNLALVEIELSNISEAKKLLQLSIEMNIQNFGIDHPQLAITYLNLSEVECELGNLLEAKKLIKLALKINSQHYKSVHPTLVKYYACLSNIERLLGNLTEAKHLLETALDICLKEYDSAYLVLVTLYTNLSVIEDKLGNSLEAKDLLKKGLEMQLKYYGPDHPKLIPLYSNLSAQEQEFGNLSEAKKLLDMAIEIGLQHYDSDSVQLSAVYNNMAALLIKENNYSQALYYIKKAHVIVHRRAKPDHPDCQVVDEWLHYIQNNLENT